MNHNKKLNHTRSKTKTESLDKLLENDEEYLTQGEFDPESRAEINNSRKFSKMLTSRKNKYLSCFQKDIPKVILLRKLECHTEQFPKR